MLALSRKAIIRYLVILLIITSVVTAIAQTFYLIGVHRGMPETLAKAFPGMELREGRLYPPFDKPYYPPSYRIAPLLNQLIGLPTLFESEADSILLVDTASESTAPLKVPLIILKATTVQILLGAEMTMEFPYEYFLFGTNNLHFTPDYLRKFMMSHSGGILFGYLFAALLHQCVLFSFSIFFLSAAAYIFRLDRQRTFKQYMKIACFAVSPVAVGIALVAVAGVKIAWVWHILIFLATLIMFRAILTINTTSRNLQGPRNNASDGT